MRHLSKELIDRFFALSASREENRQLVRHILSGCPACTALLRSWLQPAIDPEEYERLLDRFCDPTKPLNLGPSAKILPFERISVTA